MSTNPIAETDNQFAWSYDHINHVLFLKFLLNSTTTTRIVYALPTISDFVSTKATYTTNENIILTQNISGNYSASANINWTMQLIIKDSTNRSILTIDREFTLQNNQTTNLNHSIQPLNSGTYTAIANVMDHANISLSTRELNFTVTAAAPSPTWIIGVLVMIIVTILGIVYYYKIVKSSK
jgi:hypothetical protein